MPRFRDAVIAATKGVPFVPNTTQEYMNAAAKVDGALNELRIAREQARTLDGAGTGTKGETT